MRQCLMGLLFLFWPFHALFAMQAAVIYSHESAFINARFAVLATTLPSRSNARIQIDAVYSKSPEQTNLIGTSVILANTATFRFLRQPGQTVVAFIKQIDQNRATLIYPPTNGGLILHEPEQTLNALTQAQEKPVQTLFSGTARARLAAAYFLTKSGTKSTQCKEIIQAALWGLKQPEPTINQTAVMIVKHHISEWKTVLAGYYPLFKKESKEARADEISEWLNQQPARESCQTVLKR
ncbi:MAG: hypothetical protein HQL54_10630 [Magnetococcales bacterium]|nr:hypothetical protein [Magnetococcales bacterium]